MNSAQRTHNEQEYKELLAEVSQSMFVCACNVDRISRASIKPFSGNLRERSRRCWKLARSWEKVSASANFSKRKRWSTPKGARPWNWHFWRKRRKGIVRNRWPKSNSRTWPTCSSASRRRTRRWTRKSNSWGSILMRQNVTFRCCSEPVAYFNDTVVRLPSWWEPS